LLRQQYTGEFTAGPTTQESTPAGVGQLMKLDFPEVEYAARYRSNGYPPAVRRGDVNI
jgi:hypothetical protein